MPSPQPSRSPAVQPVRRRRKRPRSEARREPASGERTGSFLRRRGCAAGRGPAATACDRAAASTICGELGSPRRVHSRSARAPVRTSVSGGTTSRSARRVPPSQVRQTTCGSMLRKPPVRTDPPGDDDLARHRLPGLERIGEPLDPDAAALELGDQLGQLDGEVAAAREPCPVERRVPVARVRPKTHPDVDPAPETLGLQSRSGDRRHQRSAASPRSPRDRGHTGPRATYVAGRRAVGRGRAGRVAVPRPVVTTCAHPTTWRGDRRLIGGAGRGRVGRSRTRVVSDGLGLAVLGLAALGLVEHHLADAHRRRGDLDALVLGAELQRLLQVQDAAAGSAAPAPRRWTCACW